MVAPAKETGGRWVISSPIGPAVSCSQLSATKRTISATASVAREKYGPRRRKQMRPIGTREHRADDAAGQHAEKRRHAEAQIGQHRHIGADAEENRVAERNLTGKAAQQVPRRPEQGPEQDHDHQMLEERIVGEQRGRRQKEKSGSSQEPRHDLPTPNKPAGRNSSTSRNSTKPMVSL